MTTLTKEAIHRILGPVGDTLAAELVATGASEAELAEAWAWVSSDDALMDEGRSYPGPRSAALMEILTRWQDEEEA
jgi:hypothetical protein